MASFAYPGTVRTVVLGEPPADLVKLIERRHELGLDLYDEVWEGEYHMAPAPTHRHADLDQQLAEILGPLARRCGLRGSGIFNLGDKNDFRVPDRGLHRAIGGAWLPTAAMVIEIVSPDDETWQKLDFYAVHGVEEVLIVDPDLREVTLLRLAGGSYERVDQSALLGVPLTEITEQIEWPQ